LPLRVFSGDLRRGAAGGVSFARRSRSVNSGAAVAGGCTAPAPRCPRPRCPQLPGQAVVGEDVHVPDVRSSQGRRLSGGVMQWQALPAMPELSGIVRCIVRHVGGFLLKGENIMRRGKSDYFL